MSDEILSFPEYPTKHGCPVLVVGSGPSAYKELSIALDRLSVAPYVIAVNHMGSKVSCDAVVTGDSLMVPFMKGMPKEAVKHIYPSDQRQVPDSIPGFHFVWTGPPCASGSSSLSAVMIAKAISTGEIILCGVPLTKTGYVKDYPQADISEFNNHPEGKTMNGTVQQRLETWTKFHKAGMLAGVASFSGFTKELLGEPEFEGSI